MIDPAEAERRMRVAFWLTETAARLQTVIAAMNRLIEVHREDLAASGVQPTEADWKRIAEDEARPKGPRLVVPR